MQIDQEIRSRSVDPLAQRQGPEHTLGRDRGRDDDLELDR